MGHDPQDEAFLKGLRARAADWLVQPEARDAVPHDAFDEATHAETRQAARDYDTQIEEYRKEYDYVEDFFCDLFYLLHKGDPQVRGAHEMAPSHLGNRALIEEFAALQEVKDLRDYTRGDPFGTAMGIGSMDTELAAALARLKAAQELAEQLQKLREQLAELAQAAQDADGAGDTEAMVEALAAGMGTEGEAEGLAEALAKAVADAAAASEAQLRAAANRAVADAEEEAALASAFGVEPGALQRMDVAERQALSKRLRSSRMAAFISLFGAMRSLSIAARRRRVDNVPAEVAGLQTSDDLARLAPAEYLNLASAELESDFWMRYAQHQLSTWRTRGAERLGRGPIVLVCDESSSMTTPDIDGVTREAWSKAFVLAVADLARREKREVHYVGFASRGQVYTRSLHEGAALWEVCEHFFGGGTHYEQPLQVALDVVEEHAAQHPQSVHPDVVFITDDEYTSIAAPFLARWRAQREKHSIACYGVHIGPGKGSSGAMGQLCDTVAQLSDLAGGQSLAAHLFRRL